MRQTPVLLVLACWLSSTALVGCYEAPVLSNGPSIELQSIRLVDVANTFDDTVRFELFFQDGDGNLGMPPDLDLYPFHTFDSLPTPANWLTYAQAGRRPAFRSPSNDPNWRVVINPRTGLQDTMRIRLNPFRFNITARVMLKREDGTYVPAVNSLANGEDFVIQGRFPELNIPDGNARALEGVLRWKFGTPTFDFLFNPAFPTTYIGDTFRFEIQIRDQALNPSNTLVTGDYTLNSLRQGQSIN